MQGIRKNDWANLDGRLAEIAAMPGAELSSLTLGVVRDGGVVHEAAFGRSRICAGRPEEDRPATPATLYRVASISKPVTALAALSLVEDGRLDLGRDVSDYLGWELRNPSWPGTPVTGLMLLSHLSSLRDGVSYTMPLGGDLREFFEPGGRGWEDGAHFACPGMRAFDVPPGADISLPASPDLSPGSFFAYCNLGFGVLATVVEACSGECFDRFVKRRILEPLGTEASFNVNLLSDSAFGRLAPLYRKGAEGRYDPRAPWIAQVDDHRGTRPLLPCPALPGIGPEELGRRRPGRNGTCFSPQGGMRASVRDLCRIMEFFLDPDRADRGRVVGPGSVAAMTTSRWRFDPGAMNGDCIRGATRESGLALLHANGTADRYGGDRLRPSGGPGLWGHHGEAYGLLGGMLFHPGEGYGFAYLIGGTAEDPEKLRGRYSSYPLWEEEIQEAVLDCLLGPELPDGRAGTGRPRGTTR